MISDAIDERIATLLQARRLGPPRSELERLFFRYEQMMLRRASSFYWSDEITRAVIGSSLTLPMDTRLSIASYPVGQSSWYYFEKPVEIPGLKPFQALLWDVAPPDEGHPNKQIYIGTYGRQSGLAAMDVQTSQHLDDLKSIDEFSVEASEVVGKHVDAPAGYEMKLTDENRGASILGVRFFIAALLWIEQEIVRTADVRIERHARKRVERMGESINADIKVVTLRRVVYEGDNGDGDGREYSCRWIVRGHWRQQFYPSTGERRPKWILPYVKGPEDAPLKTPTSEVFAVTR